MGGRGRSLWRSVNGQGNGGVVRGEGGHGQGVEHLVEAEPAGRSVRREADGVPPPGVPRSPEGGER